MVRWLSETLVEDGILDARELKNMLMGEEGFRSTQKHVSARQDDIRESGEEILLKVILEVDRDIAAEEEVEDAHCGQAVLEISAFEAHKLDVARRNLSVPESASAVSRRSISTGVPAPAFAKAASSPAAIAESVEVSTAPLGETLRMP